jgi:hypothetical protein
VAATEPPFAPKEGPGEGALAALARAAMALPILAVPARAGAAEVGEMGFTVLGYRERGLIKVVEPVLWANARIAEVWELQGSLAVDIVSGASPETVTNISGEPVQVVSGASVRDRRKLADFKVSRRLGEMVLGFSRSYSDENDYTSRAYGLQGSYDFNERNTTLAIAYGHSNDRIRSTLDPALDERRDTREYLLGITQVLSPLDLVQSTLTFTRGHGWYNDPYKQTRTFYPSGPPAFMFDTRPSSREMLSWFTRYRRHYPGVDGTLQAEYRYFDDDWDVRAHTLEAAWHQQVDERWSVRPALRYYTQDAARFYGSLIPRPQPAEFSSDPRLASFGGLAASVRGILRLEGLTLEATVGYIHNSQGLHLRGEGSPVYETLRAWYGILSVSRPF